MHASQLQIRLEIQQRLHCWPDYRNSRANFERETIRILSRLIQCAQDYTSNPGFLGLLALCVESRRVWIRLLVLALTPHCAGDRRAWLIRFVRAIQEATQVRQRLLRTLDSQPANRETATRYYEDLRRRAVLAEALLDCQSDVVRVGLGWPEDLQDQILPFPDGQSDEARTATPSNVQGAAGTLAGAWWVAACASAVLESELSHEAGPFPHCLKQHHDLALTVHALSAALIENAAAEGGESLKPMISEAQAELEWFRKQVLERIEYLFLEQATSLSHPIPTQQNTPPPPDAGLPAWQELLHPIVSAARSAHGRAIMGWKECRSRTTNTVWNAWMSLLLWDRSLLPALASSSDQEQDIVHALGRFLQRLEVSQLGPNGAGTLTQADLDDFEAFLGLAIAGRLRVESLDPDRRAASNGNSTDDLVILLLDRLAALSKDLSFRWCEEFILRPTGRFFPNLPLRVSGLLAAHLLQDASLGHSKRMGKATEFINTLVEGLLGIEDHNRYGSLQGFGTLLASLVSLDSLLCPNSTGGLDRYSSTVDRCLSRLEASTGAQRFFIRYLVDDLNSGLDGRGGSGRDFPIVVAACLRRRATEFSIPFPGSLGERLDAYLGRAA